MATSHRALACAASLLLIIGVIVPAEADPGPLITVGEPSLTDSGALAADPARGVYWIKADAESVAAINPDGSSAGKISYAARPKDVQALAMFEGKLYLGDIGGDRDSVDVYRLDQMNYGSQAPTTHWTLNYPDGKHQAMTMMVSARGNIWIVTKESTGRMYYAQRPGPQGTINLTYAADAPGWVTDGVFLNSSTAILRTYTSVISYDMMNYTVVGDAKIPKQSQGESITTALDGTSLVLGSRNEPELLQVPIPQQLSDVGTAPSDPPGAGQSSADGSGDEQTSGTTEQSASSDEKSIGSRTPLAGNPSSSTGSPFTKVAVSIAVLISVGAGALAYTRSGRRKKR